MFFAIANKIRIFLNINTGNIVVVAHSKGVNEMRTLFCFGEWEGRILGTDAPFSRNLACGNVRK